MCTDLGEKARVNDEERKILRHKKEEIPDNNHDGDKQKRISLNQQRGYTKRVVDVERSTMNICNTSTIGFPKS